jgi:hypothetical protein
MSSHVRLRALFLYVSYLSCVRGFHKLLMCNGLSKLKFSFRKSLSVFGENELGKFCVEASREASKK